MQSTAAHALLDQLLSQWQEVIGTDYVGYRNHCQRMITFCFALRNCTPEEQEKVAIAACFHDIGLWTARTLDYLEPSVAPAVVYLENRGIPSWVDEIRLMITEHHRLRATHNTTLPLVEAFRQADLVDFSLGMVTFGLPRTLIREVKTLFPNAGFHKGLANKASAWFIRHPLNPAPMMKW
ncbi:MAG: hypothetical protein EPO09_21485 [Aquabacterium sp.]|uniref:hypothetical protein n=1 Tax=Aquabacterium sp. TaxID=1872578 RepID=UPI0011FAD43C|nr:hypothetical protein [Aquabacterium sp.]TAK82814.1 MAG: hypothetical protein EPO09_21485 [Aquabacterium sp.]